MDETYRIVLQGVVVEDDLAFTLEDLCRACCADPTQLIALVGEGVLHPVAGSAPEHWVFSGPSLRQARQALRLGQDLELSLAGTALVMELLQQIESLRSQLRRHGG